METVGKKERKTSVNARMLLSQVKFLRTVIFLAVPWRVRAYVDPPMERTPGYLLELIAEYAL